MQTTMNPAKLAQIVSVRKQAATISQTPPMVDRTQQARKNGYRGPVTRDQASKQALAMRAGR